MNLKSGSKTLRELFGITEERCIELCGLVDEIERNHRDWGIDAILEEASTHTENENENRFLIASYFREHGIKSGIGAGAGIIQELAGLGLFSRTEKTSRFGYRTSDN